MRVMTQGIVYQVDNRGESSTLSPLHCVLIKSQRKLHIIHIMKLCIFASSSSNTPVQYLDTARKLGEAIAKGGHLCINGGGKVSKAY